MIKVNDLIPEIQQLVFDKKIDSTTGEHIAILPIKSQETLLLVLGEMYCYKKCKQLEGENLLLKYQLEKEKVENQTNLRQLKILQNT